MGECKRLTAMDLGNPTMRVYSGMTAPVAAEKTAAGPSNALADWQAPAQTSMSIVASPSPSSGSDLSLRKLLCSPLPLGYLLRGRVPSMVQQSLELGLKKHLPRSATQVMTTSSENGSLAVQSLTVDCLLPYVLSCLHAD